MECKIVNVIVGPTITTYRIKLEDGVPFTRLKNLKDDISYRLERIVEKIEIIPSDECVSIEIKNNDRFILGLKSVIESNEYKNLNSKIKFPIGKNVYGRNIIISLEEYYNLLICGTTGSGKSLLLHSIINSFLINYNPYEVRLGLIDCSGGAEFICYNGLPHLVSNAITCLKQVSGDASRIVIETTEAKSLFGNGDMLLKRNGISRLERVQGCYISQNEIEKVVQFIKEKNKELFSSKEEKDNENKSQ